MGIECKWITERNPRISSHPWYWQTECGCGFPVYDGKNEVNTQPFIDYAKGNSTQYQIDNIIINGYDTCIHCRGKIRLFIIEEEDGFIPNTNEF